ncbi:hypothetical protein AGMMS4956_10560 [Bacteroidia bacterium]|nr:hypothetical protein AGMMS4956_10560 [Bacteroidia bacterium]
MLPQKLTYLPIVWEVRKILLFLRYFAVALCRYPKIQLISDTVKDFPTWWKTVRRNNDFLSYDQPWIVFGAKRFLDTILKKNMSVWEYGSGSSTLYYAKRVKQVYSIENDKNWFEHIFRVLKILPMALVNSQQSTVNSQQSTVNSQQSTVNSQQSTVNSQQSTVNSQQSTVTINYQLFEADEQMTDLRFFSKSDNKTFEKYVKSIDKMPDNSLDVVMVDGRARTACIAHSMAKVKQGGWLIVDNSDRKYYFENNNELFDITKWEQQEFIGLVPYTFQFSKTSFFQKITVQCKSN